MSFLDAILNSVATLAVCCVIGYALWAVLFNEDN